MGHFELLEKLGEGGMGVVYKARDTHLDRLAAIKVLPPDKVADPERKRRFVREAKAASALNHPNIVTIYDIAQSEGVDFMVMELVAGQTVSRLLEGGPLPREQALKLAIQMADALAAAHEAGIIHRDLKPGNVMVTAKGLVKVLDFGLAKLTEPAAPSQEAPTRTLTTQEGTIMGTVAYMSPEQAEGKPVDARSDIFSLGAVLYEMLSGRRAFPGDSSLAVLAAVLRQEPKPLSGEAPPALRQIVFRCLAKEPAGRFATAAELKRALEEAAAERVALLPSIAVLPFANLSADKENEYFSDGLAEEIINALTQLPGLRVTARTSAFAFRGKEIDVRDIGAKLNVDHILEGSVRKAGNRIRVTAQLIKVADGYHLWSQRFDREMTDIFAVQDEISQAIVEKLRVRLAGEGPLVKRYTENLEAYNLYLKGRYLQYKVTPEALEKSKQCFEQAIALDPGYALAWCGVAEHCYLMGNFGFLPPRESMPRAKAAALRAIEFDQTLAEAHSMLGIVRALFDFDWAEAETEFRRALELNPASPSTRERYSFCFLRPMKRLDEAVAEMERALQQDPLSLAIQSRLAYTLHLQGCPDRAIAQLQAALELAPDSYWVYWLLGVVYGGKGMLEEAVAAFERCCELSRRSALTVGLLGAAYAMAGRREEAEKLLLELHERSPRGYVPPLSIAWIYMGLQDLDRAFEWLEKAVEARDPILAGHLNTEPVYDVLRSDPRYHSLLRKMNLEP